MDPSFSFAIMGNLGLAPSFSTHRHITKAVGVAFDSNVAVWCKQSPYSVFDELCNANSVDVNEAILRLDFLTKIRPEIMPFAHYLCGNLAKQIKLSLFLARTLLDEIQISECISFCPEDMPEELVSVPSTTLAWGVSRSIRAPCATIFIMPSFYPSAEFFKGAVRGEEDAIILCVLKHIWGYYAQFAGVWLALDIDRYTPLFASRNSGQLKAALEIAGQPNAAIVH